MNKSEKTKLTLSVKNDLIKTLKVQAIQNDMTVSELVEIFALTAEHDKKVFNNLIKKYRKDK